MSKSSSGWNAHAAIERYDAGTVVDHPDRDRIGSIIVMALGAAGVVALIVGVLRNV